MDKTQLLKWVYTGGAVILGGLMYLHLVPDTLTQFSGGTMVYLVLHSFLPSAKTGALQG
jgi:zinc transporter ZupT